jgi:hypothetical protein
MTTVELIQALDYEFDDVFDSCTHCEYGGKYSKEIIEKLSRLKELEDKLESGELIEPPYHLGEQVYFYSFDALYGNPYAVYCGKVVAIKVMDNPRTSKNAICVRLEYNTPHKDHCQEEVYTDMCFKTKEEAVAKIIEMYTGELK